MLLFSQQEQQEQTGVSMGILRPIIDHAIIKPIITSVISVASSISRYFQSYNGSTSFGVLATPKVFTGDFTFSIDFATTVDTNQILLGDDHTTSYYFNMSTTGFSIFYAGLSKKYTYGAATPFDGNLHNIKYKLTGTSLGVFLDDAPLGSQTIVPYTGANNFLLGDSNNASIYFTGTLANLILVDDELDETLTFPLVADDIEYPNERDTTEYMPNGDFVTDDLTGWTPSNATQSVVNNSLELVDAGGSAHTIHLLLVPHADTDYDISIDIKAAAGNTSPLAASVTLGGTVYRVSAEDTTETITATVSSSNFGYIEIKCATWGGSNGDTAYFSNISVQKASNYLTFTDVTTELFTLEGGAWLGEERVSNYDFSDVFTAGLGADWINSGGATVSEETGVNGGSAQGVTDGSNGIVVEQGLDYISGTTYKLEVTGKLLSGSTSGYVRLLSALIGVSANVIEFNSTEWETKSYVFTAQTTGSSPVRIFGQTGSVCVFDCISIKPIINT